MLEPRCRRIRRAPSLLASLSLAALAIVSLAVTAPAGAGAGTGRLLAITCDSGPDDDSIGELFDVPLDGATPAVAIGEVTVPSPHEDGVCILGLAYDPSSELLYGVETFS